MFYATVDRSVHPQYYDPPAVHAFPTLVAALTFAKREATTPTAVASHVYSPKMRLLKTYTGPAVKARRKVLKRRR